ncbi:hypothetical protein CHUAL_009865 [Chamberlinius hualienensis]
MTIIQSCWSPCLCFNNLKQGCVAVAFYTMILCIVSIVYCSWVMTGGHSSDLYSPFFETDVNDYTAIKAGTAIIIFCILFLISGFLLILGTVNSNRGAMLPWMLLMMFLILFSLAFGIFLIARYYIDSRSVLCAVFIWVFTGFNIYSFLCVLSQYKVFKSFQTKHIIQLHS